MWPLECSAKNNVIVGVPQDWGPAAAASAVQSAPCAPPSHAARDPPASSAAARAADAPSPTPGSADRGCPGGPEPSARAVPCLRSAEQAPRGQCGSDAVCAPVAGCADAAPAAGAESQGGAVGSGCGAERVARPAMGHSQATGPTPDPVHAANCSPAPAPATDRGSLSEPCSSVGPDPTAAASPHPDPGSDPVHSPDPSLDPYLTSAHDPAAPAHTSGAPAPESSAPSHGPGARDDLTLSYLNFDPTNYDALLCAKTDKVRAMFGAVVAPEVLQALQTFASAPTHYRLRARFAVREDPAGDLGYCMWDRGGPGPTLSHFPVASREINALMPRLATALEGLPEMRHGLQVRHA